MSKFGTESKFFRTDQHEELLIAVNEHYAECPIISCDAYRYGWILSWTPKFDELKKDMPVLERAEMIMQSMKTINTLINELKENHYKTFYSDEDKYPYPECEDCLVPMFKRDDE